MRIIRTVRPIKTKEYFEKVYMVLLLVLYLAVKICLWTFISLFFDSVPIHINYNIVIGVCGVLIATNLVIPVCMVVFFDKKGFYISLILSLISMVVTVVAYIFTGMNLITMQMSLVNSFAIILMTGVIYRYGVTMQYEQFLEPIKEREQMRELLRRDALTSLWNRRSVGIKLEQLIKDPDTEFFRIIVFDVDNFKRINDTLGHQYGDLLLVELVTAWKSLLVKNDFFARLGGDEFAIIITRPVSNDDVEAYLANFREVLWETVNVDHRTVALTASFGVASYPGDGETAEQLLKYADTAMYRAKESGRNRIQFFSADMYDNMYKNMKMEEELEHALAANEMFLLYQPQYTAHGKKLRGFETLIRWNSKKLGFVSPGEFIPLAEQCGKIVKIGYWVLEEACRAFKEIQDEYGLHPMVSVNISVMQMLEKDFVERVREIITRTGIDTKSLELEITESVFISSRDHIINVLRQLREMGIQIALDDFGTEYASLSYIQMLPLDVIKIDKSFIDQVDGDEDYGKNIIGPIIDLAQNLHYEVVAEGIENEKQLEYLDNLGCDYIQGFLWGKPIKIDEVKELVHNLGDTYFD